MDRIRTLFSLATALVLLPGIGAAADDDFTRPGPYVGVGGVYTLNNLIEDQVEDAFPGVDVDVDDSAGVNAVVGYRMVSFLAAELQYEYVDGFDISAFGTKAITVRAHTFTGNLKVIAPIWRTQPYLLAGAGVVRWDFDDKLGVGISDGETAFAGRVGTGIDIFLTPNIVVNAGVDAVLTDTSLNTSFPGGEDVDYLFYITAGGGLQYRF